MQPESPEWCDAYWLLSQTKVLLLSHLEKINRCYHRRSLMWIKLSLESLAEILGNEKGRFPTQWGVSNSSQFH